MKEVATLTSRLKWVVPTYDYTHERGFRTEAEPHWIVVPCPLEATFWELLVPLYPQVLAGEKIERWQLRSGNGFITTRATAEECMELAEMFQMLMDGNDVSLVVAILERLRDRPTTRGKHFFEEMLTNVKNLDWEGA